LRASDPLPPVIAGHPHDIPQSLDELTDEMREQVIGEFAVDAHTMTPSRVRQLAADCQTVTMPWPTSAVPACP
jgi:hypothetical protein